MFYVLHSSVNVFNIYDVCQVSEVGGNVEEPQLRLTGRLDRERNASYELTLVALDGGRPARSAELAVHVIVEDANDNSPSFNHAEYIVQVREDLPIGISCNNNNNSNNNNNNNNNNYYYYYYY